MVTFVGPTHKTVTMPLPLKTSMQALYIYCRMQTKNSNDYVFIFNGIKLTPRCSGYVNDEEEHGCLLILKRLQIKHWTESDNIRYMTGFEEKECYSV